MRHREAIAGLCPQEEGEATCVSERRGSKDGRSEDDVGQWASSDGLEGVGVGRVEDETDNFRRQRIDLRRRQVAELANDVVDIGCRRDIE